MNLYISNQDIVSLDISEINELDYYSSKLCFTDNRIEGCKNSVNIKYADSLYYDEKRDIYYLPADIDEYQRCFLYRVVMDCIQVRRGNLPIHAAAVTCGINTVIIAAKPGKGKSYIADCICNSNSGCSVVGDDHVIISKNHIQGNKKRRMRSGIAVANIYYIQPLLNSAAEYFNSTGSQASLLATLTQTGYALGLFFILPIADLTERKNLILTMILLSIISLLGMYLSPNFTLACIACLAVGVTSVIPQLLLPLCAKLSDEHVRGKNIGHIMSGLLTGVVLSRVVSGSVGKYLGWKSIYIIAVIFMAMLLILLKFALPVCNADEKGDLNYFSSLKSMFVLPKKFPIVKEAAFNGAMILAAFSALWTVLTFHLQSPPFYFGTNIIGLFGILGVSGALFAPFAGKISDKKSAKFTVGINIAVIFISYICFIVFGFKVLGLVIGVILLDLGVNSCNVANQTRIQSLSESERNRITSVYMVTMFAGGAAGSYLGAALYNHFGWYGFCCIGIATQMAAGIVHWASGKRR